jgi:hypothetical protein
MEYMSYLIICKKPYRIHAFHFQCTSREENEGGHKALRAGGGGLPSGARLGILRCIRERDIPSLAVKSFHGNIL